MSFLHTIFSLFITLISTFNFVSLCLLTLHFQLYHMILPISITSLIYFLKCFDCTSRDFFKKKKLSLIWALNALDPLNLCNSSLNFLKFSDLVPKFPENQIMAIKSSAVLMPTIRFLTKKYCLKEIVDKLFNLSLSVRQMKTWLTYNKSEMNPSCLSVSTKRKPLLINFSIDCLFFPPKDMLSNIFQYTLSTNASNALGLS